MIETETVSTCGFDDIFYFAEDAYGIDWNTANDILFRSGFLPYGDRVICKVIPSEQMPLPYRDEPRTARDVSPEAFAALQPLDKARVILFAFGEANNIKGTLYVTI